jgi:hypothetical protein
MKFEQVRWLEIRFGPAIPLVKTDAEQISDLVACAVLDPTHVVSVGMMQRDLCIQWYWKLDSQAGSSGGDVFDTHQLTPVLSLNGPAQLQEICAHLPVVVAAISHVSNIGKFRPKP